VLDNVDPANITSLLDRLDLHRALFIVISKSGGTAETMAQYLVVRGRLDAALGRKGARQQLVFVTDPKKGALRTIANAEGIPALDIPPNVGGRFSVLTPVGLLPAAHNGIDTGALRAGAGRMRDRCRTASLTENIAGAFAALQYLADTKHHRPIQVLMPYSDALRDMADWFVQLWAESLGKHRKPDDAGVGPTPLGALGATDQHSKVQLFMEGPPDKTVTFIGVEEGITPVEIPRLHADVPELAYLGGHQLGELLDIERRATAGALARRGRPNMTLTLERVDAGHVGELMMLLEVATAYAGQLYGVNAYDQPGVELGKQFTYAMLGRADAEQARREWNLLPTSDPAHVI
jgi:glucose-6-phosphate isomerase